MIFCKTLKMLKFTIIFANNISVFDDQKKYKKRKTNYLVRSKRDFATTTRTTPDVAVVADVTNTIRKLSLHAYVTCRVQLNACFLVFFRSGTYRFF